MLNRIHIAVLAVAIPVVAGCSSAASSSAPQGDGGADVADSGHRTDAAHSSRPGDGGRDAVSHSSSPGSTSSSGSTSTSGSTSSSSSGSTSSTGVSDAGVDACGPGAIAMVAPSLQLPDGGEPPLHVAQGTSLSLTATLTGTSTLATDTINWSLNSTALGKIVAGTTTRTATSVIASATYTAPTYTGLPDSISATSGCIAATAPVKTDSAAVPAASPPLPGLDSTAGRGPSCASTGWSTSLSSATTRRPSPPRRAATRSSGTPLRRVPISPRTRGWPPTRTPRSTRPARASARRPACARWPSRATSTRTCRKRL